MSEGRLDENESDESQEEALNLDSDAGGEGFEPRGYTPPIIITDNTVSDE